MSWLLIIEAALAAAGQFVGLLKTVGAGAPTKPAQAALAQSVHQLADHIAKA